MLASTGSRLLGRGQAPGGLPCIAGATPVFEHVATDHDQRRRRDHGSPSSQRYRDARATTDQVPYATQARSEDEWQQVQPHPHIEAAVSPLTSQSDLFLVSDSPDTVILISVMPPRARASIFLVTIR